MKKILLVFALILFFAFPAVSSRVISPVRSVDAYVTAGSIIRIEAKVATAIVGVVGGYDLLLVDEGY